MAMSWAHPSNAHSAWLPHYSPSWLLSHASTLERVPQVASRYLHEVCWLHWTCSPCHIAFLLHTKMESKKASLPRFGICHRDLLLRVHHTLLHWWTSHPSASAASSFHWRLLLRNLSWTFTQEAYNTTKIRCLNRMNLPADGFSCVHTSPSWTTSIKRHLHN